MRHRSPLATSIRSASPVSSAHAYTAVDDGEASPGVLARPRFSVDAPSVPPTHDPESENEPSDAVGVDEPLDSIVGPLSSSSRSSSFAGPRTAAFLCACAGVAALAAMGVGAVGAPLLGLPLGAWMIAGVVGATHAVQSPHGRVRHAARRLLDRAGRARTSARGSSWATLDALPTPAVPRLRLADAVNSADRLRDAATAVRGISSRAAAASLRTINDQLDPALSSARAAIKPNRRYSGPLRVTASMDSACASLLLTAAAGRAMSEQLAQWESADPADEYGIVLDGPGSPRVGVVVYKRDPHTLVIEPVRRGRDQAEHNAHEHEGWDDWSTPLPTGYAGLFPLRLDAARVTLTQSGDSPLIDDGTAAALIVALAEAAGELTRCAGRRTAAGTRERRQAGPSRTPGPDVNAALRALAAALSDRLNDAADPSRDPACRAAARVLSAWAVSSHSAMTEPELLSIAQLAAGVLADEAAVLLRLAAAEYAAGEERRGTGTLVRAYRLLRRENAACAVDPLAFILAELELGTPGPLTLGRVAAGVTLLWATSPDENLTYLHDDLLEDLHDAGRFGHKSHEVAALGGVIAALDAARVSDEPPTRLSKAA